MITTTHARFDERGVDVIRAGTDGVDLRDALDSLVERPRVLRASSWWKVGRRSTGLFTDADLFEEINATTCPLTVEGDGPRMVTDAFVHSHRFELAHLIVDDASYVYTRWCRSMTLADEVGVIHAGAPEGSA